jgi:hypothetical protein
MLALAPNGADLYVSSASNPSHVAHFNISSGAPVLVSSRSTDVDVCHGLYVDGHGAQLLGGCGAVYHLSDDPAADLSYKTALPVPNSVAAASYGATRERYAVIFNPEASFSSTPEEVRRLIRAQVHEFAGANLEALEAATLPEYEEAGQRAPLWGRWLAYSHDESSLYVIAQTPDDSVLPRRSAVVTLPGALRADPDAPSLDDDGRYHLLHASVVDAEYSAALERIVLVTQTPPQLAVLDPRTRAQQSVSLVRAPIDLVLSPSGEQAVVVYDGWVEHYALEPLIQLRRLDLPMPAKEVALIANDQLAANLYSSGDRWFRANLSTGAITRAANPWLTSGLGRYRPEDRAFYSAELSRFERFALEGDALSAPTHADVDYEVGGAWWPGEDGRLFGEYGHVFGPGTSLLYRGTLAGYAMENYSSDRVLHLDHAAAANLIAAIHSSGATRQGGMDRDVRLYEDHYLTALGNVRLPAFSVAGSPVVAFPRYAFISPDGKRLDVLAQADPLAPLARNYGLISADIGTLAPCPVSAPVPLVTRGNQQGAVVLEPLAFDVRDAAFSRPLDRLVIVSSDPPRLRLIDPASAQVAAELALPVPPTRVVVEADGRSALVGHAGWLTRVALAPLAVTATLPLSASAADISAESGTAYVVPTRDQSTQLRALALDGSGEMRTAIVYAASRLRVAPDGQSLLLVTPTNIGSDDLRRISRVAADTPPPDPTSISVQGTVISSTVGHNFWFSRDGKRLFGGTADVLDFSDPLANPLPVLGTLAGIPSVLAFDQAATGRIAVVPDMNLREDENNVRIFDGVTYAELERTALPPFLTPTSTIRTSGMFVFFSNDGAQVYVLVEANNTQPLTSRYGLVRMPVTK